MQVNDNFLLAPSESLTNSVREIIGGILSFLFPLQCLVCSQRLHSMSICYRCWPEQPPYFYYNRCERCFTPLNSSELLEILTKLSLLTSTNHTGSLDKPSLYHDPAKELHQPLTRVYIDSPPDMIHCPPPCYDLPSISFPTDRNPKSCNKQHVPILPQILCNNCKLFPSLIHSMRFLWDYRDRTRDLIVTMKYRPSNTLCSYLAKILSQQSHKLGLINFDSPPDIIAPIPITRRSYSLRKFHQTGLLAKILTNLDRSLPNARINLLKTRANKAAQASLRHSDRFKNVSGSFLVTSSVSGKSVLLVEDVITTGATISAAASTLLQAGAKSVSILALARSATWETFRLANYHHFSPLKIQSYSHHM